mgnify:CR=1 FL=1
MKKFARESDLIYNINKEWTEDDNDDNYPLNLLTPEELEFIENHRMKLLGLV